jgi:hypothetical protein
VIGKSDTAAIVNEEDGCGETVSGPRLDDFRVCVHSMCVAQKLKCQVTVGPGNIETICVLKKTNIGGQAKIVEARRSKHILKSDRIVKSLR